MKLPLLVIVGPTAVGKTAIAVETARHLGAEIISGDSMQVYRGMDIGTAKIRSDEMQGVPHHLIDIREPDEPISVAEFQARADGLIAEIAGRGRLPMLVGGTGLYVRAVLEEYTFTEMEADPALRIQLAGEEKRFGPGHLHRRLAEVDPESAARLHPHDLRRVVRALEVFLQMGSPISAMQTAAGSAPRYDDLLIGLTMDRAELGRRIEARVDAMMEQGLEAEVRSLLDRYGPSIQALEAIGYKEMLQYRRGLITYTEAVGLIKRHTRQFAKRQFTWFRRERRLNWFDVTEASQKQVVEEIARLVEGKRIADVEPGNLWRTIGTGYGGHLGV